MKINQSDTFLVIRVLSFSKSWLICCRAIACVYYFSLLRNTVPGNHDLVNKFVLGCAYGYVVWVWSPQLQEVYDVAKPNRRLIWPQNITHGWNKVERKVRSTLEEDFFPKQEMWEEWMCYKRFRKWKIGANVSAALSLYQVWCSTTQGVNSIKKSL